MMSIRSLSLLIIACLLAIGCHSSEKKSEFTNEETTEFLKKMDSPPEIRELRRLSDPTAQIDAILCIKETGATVATPTEVYLLSKGKPVEGEPVFRADYVDNIQVDWETGTVLKISATRARTFLTTPSYKVSLDEGEFQTVKILIQIDNLLTR